MIKTIVFKKIAINGKNYSLKIFEIIINGKNMMKLSYAMFRNNDFIGKFKIDSNLLFGKLKNFKFGFESNSTICF